jgi:long-subunit acyl-CoA synthetase (AMP-forming)
VLQIPKRDSLATICYTSGTTGKSAELFTAYFRNPTTHDLTIVLLYFNSGNPKGAMMTHANMVSEVSAIQFMLAKVCLCFDFCCNFMS